LFAVPLEEVGAEESAVCEYPSVELDVVDGAAVIEDVTWFEACVGVDCAEFAEEAVSGGAEEVGPLVGAAWA
jgi:hypothetical protein